MLRIAYEMNITQPEFERLLPAAVDYAPFAVRDAVYSGHAGGGSWRIRLGPPRERRIGAIRLPLRDVEIEIEGMGEEGAAAFRRRFDLYFQKGGG